MKRCSPLRRAISSKWDKATNAVLFLTPLHPESSLCFFTHSKLEKDAHKHVSQCFQYRNENSPPPSLFHFAQSACSRKEKKLQNLKTKQMWGFNPSTNMHVQTFADRQAFWPGSDQDYILTKYAKGLMNDAQNNR